MVFGRLIRNEKIIRYSAPITILLYFYSHMARIQQFDLSRAIMFMNVAKNFHWKDH